MELRFLYFILKLYNNVFLKIIHFQVFFYNLYLVLFEIKYWSSMLSMRSLILSDKKLLLK